jgi:hypothetical protein
MPSRITTARHVGLEVVRMLAALSGAAAWAALLLLVAG